MGCRSCGNSGSGGCGSNGGCSSGGCNKLNVFNWLSEIPISDFGKPYQVIEVSFNHGNRKDFFLNDKGLSLYNGELITVEGVNGFDVCQVSLTGELVKLQLKKHQVKEEDVTKKVLRISNDKDIDAYNAQKEREKEVLVRARAIARTLGLEMKISETEIQADGKKISVFYTAQHRVDFRELLKIFASEFNARIEMRQIGARQESAKMGGIGSCGRELCCSTWLTDFKTVYTSAARYQNLAINQSKLSGQCGKLKCCLNYELDNYMDALKDFPEHAEMLEFKSGKAKLVKKDIFKKLLWYSFDKSSKQYPLSIESVRHILSENKKGILPDELQAEEITPNGRRSGIGEKSDFVNDVGTITLQSLARTNKKRKSNNKNNKRKFSTKKGTLQQKSGNRPKTGKQ